MNNDGGLIGTIERDRDKSKGTFTSPQNTMIIGTPPLSSNKLSRAARTQLSKAGVTDTFATAEDRNENVNKIFKITIKKKIKYQNNYFIKNKLNY